MNFKNKRLNKDIPVPLYYQLKGIILEEIKKYKCEEDNSIPTENELSEVFNISRPTVSQALNELVSEGYIYRIKGKGTFIAPPKISQEFTSVIETFIPFKVCSKLIDVDFEKFSLYDSLERYNIVVKKVKRTFEAKNATESDAKVLAINIGDALHYFETMAYLDGDIPIEYSLCKYRGDRNKFTVEIEK